MTSFFLYSFICVFLFVGLFLFLFVKCRYVFFSSELLPSADGHMKTSLFLMEVVDILLDYIRKNNDRSTKVLDFHHPHTLKEMMGHCLDIQEDPQNLEQILSDCKETLKYCVKTGELHW